jgi:hypothetical protein
MTTTVIYYQVGRGNGTFILLAVLGITVQTASIFAIANSLTDVAQVLFAGNVILLSLGLLLDIAAPLRRASLGCRTSAAMGPEPSS